MVNQERHMPIARGDDKHMLSQRTYAQQVEYWETHLLVSSHRYNYADFPFLHDEIRNTGTLIEQIKKQNVF